MTIKRIGIGPRMSACVVYGGVARLAGFVADQTAEILSLIDATLKEAGTDKTKILKVNIWLTDMKTFSQMNEAWDAWVPKDHTPARATVQSPALAAPGLDVEIMVEAAV